MSMLSMIASVVSMDDSGLRPECFTVLDSDGFPVKVNAEWITAEPVLQPKGLCSDMVDWHYPEISYGYVSAAASSNEEAVRELAGGNFGFYFIWMKTAKTFAAFSTSEEEIEAIMKEAE